MCYLRIYHRLIAAFCMVSSLYCVAQEPAVSSEVSYLSFAVPGALGTYPMSLNKSMVVTGYYLASPTVARGFVRDAEGTITTFDVWGGLWTEPESINAHGDITGFFEVVAGVPQGFLRYADGRIIKINPPCTEYLYLCNMSQPVSINDYGEIAGSYPYLGAGAPAGFTRSKAGDFTTYHFGQGASYGTVFTGINASGDMVGFTDQSDSVTGLGTGAFPVKPSKCVEATLDESVNANGVVAGWYTHDIPSGSDPCGLKITSAYVNFGKGVLTAFTPPGTLVTSPRPGYEEGGVTFLGDDAATLEGPGRLSINQSGSITGSYLDAAGAQHGFVRNPYGTVTSFDPPRGENTTAVEINDNGVIVGSYFYDWNAQIAQGFLRIPKS